MVSVIGTAASALLTVSYDVPGLDADKFAELANGAKENCPVSKALAAVPITLTINA